MKKYSFVGQVELFPQDNGWHYVSVPVEQSKSLLALADRGLIAVTVTIGASSWPTSLLPLGDGTHFIALPAKVRKKENINLDDKINVTFIPRER